MKALISTVNIIVDKHVPLKFVKGNKHFSRKSWLTTGLRNSINKKDSLYKKYLTHYKKSATKTTKP